MSDFIANSNINNSFENKRNNNFNSNEGKVLFNAKVISIEDENDAMRIRAKIPEFDLTKPDNDTSLIAFPLLPKIGNVIYPKVGEEVFIFLQNPKSQNTKRYYIGPIIPQFQKIKKTPSESAMDAVDGSFNLEESIRNIPSAKNVFPVENNDKDNVTHLGRDNTDILHREEKLLLRAGKHEKGNPKLANTKNPSYQQLSIFNNDDERISSNLISSDNILLYSYNGDKLITNTYANNDDILNFIKKGYSLVRGEKLIEFLKLVTEFIFTHTHPYNNKETLQKNIELANKIKNFNFNDMLNTGIKLN